MDCENLEMIDFPSTFKSFSAGWDILRGCLNLKKLILRSDSLIDINDLTTYSEGVDVGRCILCVPRHLVESYSNHSQWKHFMKIIQVDII